MRRLDLSERLRVLMEALERLKRVVAAERSSAIGEEARYARAILSQIEAEAMRRVDEEGSR